MDKYQKVIEVLEEIYKIAKCIVKEQKKERLNKMKKNNKSRIYGDVDKVVNGNYETIYDIPEDEETLTPNANGIDADEYEEEQIYYIGADDYEDEEQYYDELEENREIFRLFLKLLVGTTAGILLTPIILMSSIINAVVFLIIHFITQMSECIKMLSELEIK